MAAQPLTLSLKSADETSNLAQRLAERLGPGDTILLTGSVGSGKTHFARSLIQHILLAPEDVPSPTFTLVQTYETHKGPLWHSDLYRISSSYEIDELGLIEAFEDCICLVEWPDRLAELTPSNALDLSFEPGDDELSRTLTANWRAAKWDMLSRIWAV